jgi:hypothetical protein
MSTGLRNAPFLLQPGRRVGESKIVQDFPYPNRKKPCSSSFAVVYQLIFLIFGFATGKMLFLPIAGILQRISFRSKFTT